MTDPDPLQAARNRMVETQIARRGVSDPAVLQAMRETPREAFVPEAERDRAFDDAPVSIGAGQTISQPFMVAFMAEAAQIGPEDRVLEVGAGSGYAAAVLSRLAAQVYTVERHADLAGAARERLARLGYANVEVRAGDGAAGWPRAQPFDAILVAAGAREVSPALKAQLRIGGRLIAPIGASPRRQQLFKLTRTGPDDYALADLGPVLFVPLIGEHGWSEDDTAYRPTPL